MTDRRCRIGVSLLAFLEDKLLGMCLEDISRSQNENWSQSASSPFGVPLKTSKQGKQQTHLRVGLLPGSVDAGAKRRGSPNRWSFYDQIGARK